MSEYSKILDEWKTKIEEAGIKGKIRIVSSKESNSRELSIGKNDGLIEIENHTKIPRELTPYLHELLQERDRLVKAVIRAIVEIEPETIDIPMIRKSCLELAIGFIRKKYFKGGISSEQAIIDCGAIEGSQGQVRSDATSSQEEKGPSSEG